MKQTLLTLLCSQALVGSSFATVTLDFSTIGNVLKDFADTSSVVTNGMAWGIVVDTQDNGFTNPFVASVGLMAEDGANFGDGYFFYNPLTQDGSHVTFFSGLLGGGNGAIDFNTFDSFGDANPIAAGQKFAVVWFGDTAVQNDSNLAVGTSYGIATSATATLPADSNSVSYVGEFSSGVKSSNLSFIPEPSTALLALLGFAGILRRKR